MKSALATAALLTLALAAETASAQTCPSGQQRQYRNVAGGCLTAYGIAACPTAGQYTSTTPEGVCAQVTVSAPGFLTDKQYQQPDCKQKYNNGQFYTYMYVESVCAAPPTCPTNQSIGARQFCVEYAPDGVNCLAQGGEPEVLEACTQINGTSCAVKLAGMGVSTAGGTFGTNWKSTGQSCNNEKPGGSFSTPQTINGNTVEKHPTNSACILVNGQESCYSSAGGVCAEGECLPATNTTSALEQPDGSKITTAAAGTPPAPDTGTPGQRATPDLTMKAPRGSGTQVGTYHYFGAGTVGASSPAGNGNGAGDGDGDGDGDCEGEDCGEGEGESGGLTGPGGTAKSFGESIGDFQEAVEGSPLLEAVRNISNATTAAGSCPPLSFPAFNTTIATDIHCDLAGNLSPLAFVFLAIYAVIGVRIVMSA